MTRSADLARPCASKSGTSVVEPRLRGRAFLRETVDVVAWRVTVCGAVAASLLLACGTPTSESSRASSTTTIAESQFRDVRQPPIVTGARSQLLANGAQLFVFGDEPTLHGVVFERGSWRTLPELDVLAGAAVLMESGDLLAVGMNCDGECERAEIWIGRLAAGGHEWAVERAVDADDPDFFSVKPIGAVGGDAFFYVGPELWRVDARKGFDRADGPGTPWELCLARGAVVSVEPAAHVTDDTGRSTYAFDHAVVQKLEEDLSWSDPQPVPGGLSGLAQPICVEGGVALVGDEQTAVWRDSTWTLMDERKPPGFLWLSFEPTDGGAVGLAENEVVALDATGWRTLGSVSLREPSLAELTPHGDQVAVLDPASVAGNDLKITLVHDPARAAT